MTMVLCLTMFF